MVWQLRGSKPSRMMARANGIWSAFVNQTPSRGEVIVANESVYTREWLLSGLVQSLRSETRKGKNSQLATGFSPQMVGVRCERSFL